MPTVEHYGAQNNAKMAGFVLEGFANGGLDLDYR